MSLATLPARSEVPVADTWDLSRLFAGPDEWETVYDEWVKMIDGYARFRGRLGESAETLAECLDFDIACDRLGDRVQTYASLRESEDTADAAAQAMRAKMLAAASKAGPGRQLHPPGNPGHSRRADGRIPAFAGPGRSQALRWNGCSAIGRTRSRSPRKNCWRCSWKWPSRPGRRSASSPTPT